MENEKIFTKEDIVLYCFTLVLIIGIAVYFHIAQNDQITLIKEAYTLEVPPELRLDKSDPLELSFYKAQIQQINKMAGHSSRAIVALTTIRFFGFLVGMTMIFLGAIMIIRGIRNTPTQAEGTLTQQASFKIASSSPGVLFSFFGTIVIVVTIWKSSNASLKSKEVQNYSQRTELNTTSVPEDTIKVLTKGDSIRLGL